MGVKVFVQEQHAIKLWGFDTITVRSNVCFLSTKLRTGAYQSVSWPLKGEGLCAAGGIGYSRFLMIPYEEARTSAGPSLLQRGSHCARCRRLPQSPDSPQVEGEISLEPRKLSTVAHPEQPSPVCMGSRTRVRTPGREEGC